MKCRSEEGDGLVDTTPAAREGGEAAATLARSPIRDSGIQTLNGPFSAVSKPILQQNLRLKSSLCTIVQGLEDLNKSAPLQNQNVIKVSAKS